MTEFVRLEVADGVGTIRLDRPPLNAISRQVQEELIVVADESRVTEAEEAATAAAEMHPCRLLIVVRRPCAAARPAP